MIMCGSIGSIFVAKGCYRVLFPLAFFGRFYADDVPHVPDKECVEDYWIAIYLFVD